MASANTDEFRGTGHSWRSAGGASFKRSARLEDIESKLGDLAAMMVFGDSGPTRPGSQGGYQVPDVKESARARTSAASAALLQGMPQGAPGAVDSPGFGLSTGSPIGGGLAVFENWETIVRPRLAQRRGNGARVEKLEKRVAVLEGLLSKQDRGAAEAIGPILEQDEPLEEKAQDVAAVTGAGKQREQRGPGKRGAMVPGTQSVPGTAMSLTGSDASGDITLDVQALVTEVRQLRGDVSENRKALKAMGRELEAVHKRDTDSRGSSRASARGKTAGASAEAPEAGAPPADASKRAEAAAAAAEAAAQAASRLREEVEEYVKAFTVPFGPPPGEEEEADDAPQPKSDEQAGAAAAAAAEAAEYMERQMQIERQLLALEGKLEQNMSKPAEGDDGKEEAKPAGAEHEFVQGLKFVVQDVRKCLKRCELLVQLPEIRVFMRRFQRSLEVNAILHEKWVGPDGARSPRAEDESQSGLPSRRSLGASQSVPNFRNSPEASHDDADARPRSGITGGATVKKRPFRTVVDWTRPHTPLALEPVLQLPPRPGERVRLPSIAK